MIRSLCADEGCSTTQTTVVRRDVFRLTFQTRSQACLQPSFIRVPLLPPFSLFSFIRSLLFPRFSIYPFSTHRYAHPVSRPHQCEICTPCLDALRYFVSSRELSRTSFQGNFLLCYGIKRTVKRLRSCASPRVRYVIDESKERRSCRLFFS